MDGRTDGWTDGQGPDHIPWRESRLTSLLKPCLSPDNAHTLFVCTISNRLEHFANALDTLRCVHVRVLRYVCVLVSVMAAENPWGTPWGVTTYRPQP